jgi:hypothetical protein
MLTRHSRGYLPHIEIPDATYFLTFRLHDSLPAPLIFQWNSELQSQKLQQTRNAASMYLLEKEYFRKIQDYLDTNTGNCWLGNPKNRQHRMQAKTPAVLLLAVLSVK